MENLLTTIILAFAVLAVALLVLGIGWLITGKNQIVRGACGMDPKKARDARCGGKDISCDICGKEPEKKDE